MGLVAKTQLREDSFIRPPPGDQFARQPAFEFAHPNPWRLTKAQKKEALELAQRNAAQPRERQGLEPGNPGHAFPILNK